MSQEIKISGKGGEVTFKVRPKITISQDALYEDQGLPGAGGVVEYKVTNNKKYAFSVDFIARTKEEAIASIKDIRLLDSWLTSSPELGQKPSLLTLSGYGDFFRDIPTVMTSCSFELSDAFDYINSGKEWIPIVVPLSFTLIESHTDDALKAYSITSFREGTLQGF